MTEEQEKKVLQLLEDLIRGEKPIWQLKLDAKEILKNE